MSAATAGAPRPLDDPREFLRLSADAHYLLTVSEELDEGLLHGLLGASSVARWTPDDRQTALEAVRYLREAYGDKRRRLGPAALLHPLRTAALLGRAAGTIEPEAILLALLHDKLEDIRADAQGEARWKDLEQRFQTLIKRLSPEGEWYLMEKLEVLTQRDGEPYTRYLGRIVERAPAMPDLVRVKAADRLDNTLDLWVFGARDPLEGIDFFEAAFRGLFLPRAAMGPGAELSLEPFSISKRLYELFKGVVLLSLVRVKGVGSEPAAAALLEALAGAGLREAQRVLLLAFARDWPDAADQRRILLDTMEYCHGGGVEAVTSAGRHRLDGLFVEHFDHADSQLRRARLASLEQDKDRRACAAAAFVAIFLGFRQDPSFHVRGVVPEGIRAQ